ncbi:MAG: B12-binding domain-containing radical SAM protein [Nitrospirae bacterium]|nr:B12-binding domain-containing radical SAM protein [Nitrospirota bacterium]
MQLMKLSRARKQRKLLLVDPYPRESPYHLGPSERKAIWFPKLSLPAIAAYTPEHWDIEIQDESVREIDFDYPADMVGISIMTCYAPRAYQIAEEFKRRGVPVVLGGVHPTYCPDEALQHCDAIVTGEAEESWPRLVEDFEAGRMQRHYKMEQFPPLDHYKPPRVDLLSEDAYMTRQCTFTTRGCHFDCEFCSVSPFNGKSTRRRPVAEVVAEIQRVKGWVCEELVGRIGRSSMLEALKIAAKIRFGIEDGSIFAFVDDLHNSNRAYCRELWAALKPLNIKWGCQSTLFLGDDQEMVKLAAESGCVSVFVGLESIFEESLGETHKPFNKVKKFEEEIKMFHDHGIMVNPGIVFGFDNDDESVFERTVEFLVRNHCELAYFNVLTPLPGTPLQARYEAAGRIFDRNWAHYDGKHVTFRPTRMTPEQLQEGFHWAQHHFYSLPNIWKRISSTSQRIIPRFQMNWEFRRVINRACPKGGLSPVAAVIKTLQAKLPSVEMENPIPNALLALKKVSGQVDQFLSIKARKHEKLTALLVDLEGALDRINAAELKTRLAEAALKAKLDIIVNFEHVRHATPQALDTLLDGEFFKKAAPSVRVRYRKIQEAFALSLEGMRFHGLDLLAEDLQDA